MKVIFVDVVGVLISKKSHESILSNGNIDKFDIDCVNNFNTFCSKYPEYNIVLKGKWKNRFYSSPKPIISANNKFEEEGVKFPVFDLTDMFDKSFFRIEEVNSYVKKNKVSDFIIIDDYDYSNCFYQNIVKTSFEEGFIYAL